MNDKPDFAFGKTLGMAECCYGDIEATLKIIRMLFQCMKDTNKHHETGCEFFRLDFRPPYLDETLQFPRGALIFDLKWGSKKELKEKKE